MDIFVVKCTGRGLVVKRPGVLSKVQMLNLVLGVGVFSLLPTLGPLGNVHQVLLAPALAKAALEMLVNPLEVALAWCPSQA